MKVAVFLLLVASVSQAQDQLASTIPNVSLKNAHVVSSHVIRGSQPSSMQDITQLKNIGVTDVLIFKNEAKSKLGEIAREQAMWGSSTRVNTILFPWQNITDFPLACSQVVQGLKLLASAELNPGKQEIFFHCSEGQDRTGLLAGLFWMLRYSSNADDVFQNQMCRYGYENGVPGKWRVAPDIQKSLTPLFIALSEAIAKKQLTLSSLDESICNRLQFSRSAAEMSHFRCSQPAKK